MDTKNFETNEFFVSFVFLSFVSFVVTFSL